MLKQALTPLLVAAVLILQPAADPDGGAAFAQACLSAGDARTAVQQGRARNFSSLLPAIRSQAGGDVLPGAQLCNGGGGLVYRVNVLAPGGQVKRMSFDAASGAFMGQ